MTAAALMVTALSGCGLTLGAAPLPTVEFVDVERYMGTWYEIAKYPNAFERGCEGVTAEYTLMPRGDVRVVNVCRTPDGGVDRRIEGFATVADKSTNAKLTVFFFFPFGAPYWIIDLDDEYTYAVVGDPSRTYLWILSRTPTMDQQIYEAIVQKLPDLGYDPGRLELTQQFPENGS